MITSRAETCGGGVRASVLSADNADGTRSAPIGHVDRRRALNTAIMMWRTFIVRVIHHRAARVRALLLYQLNRVGVGSTCVEGAAAQRCLGGAIVGCNNPSHSLYDFCLQ